MTEEKGDESLKKCDLKALREFLAREKGVMLYVRKEDPTAMSDLFENESLAEFFQKCKGSASQGLVGIDEKDPACIEVLKDLKVDSMPTVIAFKDGVELERLVPDGDKAKEVSALKRMEEKMSENDLRC